MVEIRRLQPHDPVPEGGRYMLVLKRFGEDNPRVTITEIIRADGNTPPGAWVPVRQDGEAMDFDQAVRAADAEADRAGFNLLYVVDRTAGRREHDVLEHSGDRTVDMDRLSDTDPEDGELGTDLRDRPADAGYNLTPER